MNAETVFSAVQAFGVLIALLVGLSQARDFAQKRSLSSLQTMLDQWRRSSPDRDVVLKVPPIGLGNAIEDRCIAMARVFCSVESGGSRREKDELAKWCRASRSVVQELNDLGAFVERGGVNQYDFFSHFHVRIIELVYSLEPYLLLVSASRGSRWGMRLIAMRDASVAYHQSHPVHSGINITTHGLVLADQREAARWPRGRAWVAEHRNFLKHPVVYAADGLALIDRVRAVVSEEIDIEDLNALISDLARRPQ